MVITGHRGAMAEEPENTMRSFRRAVADGADEIELDLRVSVDGVVVICHDAAAERTTTGHGAIDSLTWAELNSFDAGKGESIPRFDDVLDEIALPMQAEIKSAAAIEPLIRRLTASTELRERITPASFDEVVVEEVAARLPGVPVALIVGRVRPGLVEKATALGAAKVFCGWEGLHAPVVAAAHAAGVEITGWPTLAAAEIDRAVDLGLDGVTTDSPATVRAHLAARRGC